MLIPRGKKFTGETLNQALRFKQSVIVGMVLCISTLDLYELRTHSSTYDLAVIMKDHN